MSGGAFDYNQHHIDGIAAYIEEEILHDTLTRPMPTQRKRVLVSSIKHYNDCKTIKFYSEYNFKDIESAKKYFSNCSNRDEFEIVDVSDTEFKCVYNKESIFTYDECDMLEVIVKEITEEVYLNKDGNEIIYRDYSPETIQELKNAVKLLKKASIYANRIDWLFSGDDSEDTFHKRLKMELSKLEEDLI